MKFPDPIPGKPYSHLYTRRTIPVSKFDAKASLGDAAAPTSIRNVPSAPTLATPEETI
jgi:hypothetical protein